MMITVTVLMDPMNQVQYELQYVPGGSCVAKGVSGTAHDDVTFIISVNQHLMSCL